MDLSIFDSLESEVRSYVRSFPVVFDKAHGSVMADEDGKEYVDFFCGAGALNYGHNNPRFKQELIAYLQGDSVVHSLDMATTAKARFLTTFATRILQPRNLPYKVQFTGPTGANAIEAALKLARLVTGRVQVVAFTHGFHGVSSGALTVTASAKFRMAAGQPLGNVAFLPFDGYLGKDFDTVDYLEKLLSDSASGLDRPAAVIVETVQGEGGVNVASAGWLRSLAGLCRDSGILLIADDIQVGCGRTGSFFSFEEAGIIPDLVILSKSLSGYGLPMSIVLLKPEHDIWQPGAHNGTFRGNNLAFVAAAAALENYWMDDTLTRETIRKGLIVRKRLEQLAADHPDAGFVVRGRGLINGLVSTRHPDLAKRIARSAFDNGLVIETAGSSEEVLKLLPALTIGDDLLTRGLDIIQSSVEDVLG